MTGQILTSDGPRDVPERALVVVAHPDDVDFGAAGTVNALTAAGCSVSYCLVTSGGAGEASPDVWRHDVTRLRETEQTAAARVAGVIDLHFLHHRDGEVQATLGLRRDIARVIRIVRPDLVICQSPERNWDRMYSSHPDHLAAAEATVAAVYPDARNPHGFVDLLDEGHQPHTVPEMWVMGIEPNLYVDITDTIAKKVQGLRCHHSQVDRMENLEELMRKWAGEVAARGGMPEGRMAESFRVVNTA